MATGSSKETKKITLTPQQVVLGVIDKHREEFGETEMNLRDLASAGVLLGCPNLDVAQGVIGNMVEGQSLTFREDDEGNIWISEVIEE